MILEFLEMGASSTSYDITVQQDSQKREDDFSA